jgi:hypothetical protein
MIDEVTSPKAANPVRMLAKTMWQMDTTESFETNDARKVAYGAAKVEYKRKAKRLIKMLEKKGANLEMSGE